MTQLCRAQGDSGRGERWYCIGRADHPGPHTDDHGRARHLPSEALQELVHRWGRTHRVAYTGTLWVAVHRDPHTHWRTEIEPTPELLEVRLREHHGPPPGPAPELEPGAVPRQRGATP
ncbi:hypothetical protein [Nocardiopsis sp. NPDC006832]|uniref:hypothetical protein n=1 Tax=Nocardiopsis sp. NPDC006832 TaxID=3157188 RepID=UPI0033EA0616